MIGIPKQVWTSTIPGSEPKSESAASTRTMGYMITWYGMKVPSRSTPKIGFAQRTFQKERA